MLTKTEIKNIKKGNPIYINTTFDHVDNDGDIWFNAPIAGIPEHSACIDPSHVHLPIYCQSPATARSAGAETGQSEYDPTRPFKAGDIVTPQSINGRSYGNIARKIEGIPFRVVHDETTSAIITIVNEEDKHYIHPAFLKLILPVEERERYSVHHSTAGIWQVIDTKDNGIISNYVAHRHPNAQKAAETEAARLNAEHTANNHSTPTT